MTVSDFAVPIHDRYFEDYLPGTVFEYATAISVDEVAIIEFSRQFDPMSFHIDPEAASRGPYGG